MLFFTLLLGCAGGNAEAGEAIFTANCVVCHGADGKEAVGGASDLTVEVPELDDAEIEDVVLNGKETMPPLALEEQDLADLIAYLRATFG